MVAKASQGGAGLLHSAHWQFQHMEEAMGAPWSCASCALVHGPNLTRWLSEQSSAESKHISPPCNCGGLSHTGRERGSLRDASCKG